MLKDIVHNGLFVVAMVMFIVGAILGVTWGVSSLFDNGIIESGMQAKIGWRILGVLFFGSAGIFHMLSFSNYKQKRQERWKESKG